jgi:hypothetical protein
MMHPLLLRTERYLELFQGEWRLRDPEHCWEFVSMQCQRSGAGPSSNGACRCAALPLKVVELKARRSMEPVCGARVATRESERENGMQRGQRAQLRDSGFAAVLTGRFADWRLAGPVQVQGRG